MTAIRHVGIVDMGSNAIRTEIIEFDEHDDRTMEKRRAPIRLGDDVFTTGAISEENMKLAIEAMRGFRETCDGYRVDCIRGYATSAVREATNGAEFLDRLVHEAGVKIRAISGLTEAEFLQLAIETRIDTSHGSFLLADLGGGSVELVRATDGKVAAAKTFPCGSIRLLRSIGDAHGELVGTELTAALRHALEPTLAMMNREFGGATDHCVATGGNIETISELIAIDHELGVELDVLSCTVEQIDDLVEHLAELPQRDRMTRYTLRPDRADTIVPAGIVYGEVARIAGCRTIAIPRVGIRSGIRAATIRELRTGGAPTG